MSPRLCIGSPAELLFFSNKPFRGQHWLVSTNIIIYAPTLKLIIISSA